MLEMSEAPFQKTPIQSIDLYASPKAQYERIAYSLATRLFPELYQSLRAENGSAKEIAHRMQEVIGCEIFFQKSRKGKSQGFSGERFYEINEYWESGLSWRAISEKYREVGIHISHSSPRKGYYTALAKFSADATNYLERRELLDRIKDAQAKRGTQTPSKAAAIPEMKPNPALEYDLSRLEPETNQDDLLSYIESVEAANPFISTSVTKTKKENIDL